MIRGKGFTLIELLIVIAIILILISIALPNFMEAQIRARVAQTKGNMRSIQMAMESHLIDWGDVVPDYNDIKSVDSDIFRDHVSRLRARVPGGFSGCASPRAACSCYSPGDPPTTGSVRFVNGPSGFYSLGMLCPLTTPMKYLNANEIMDPFGSMMIPHGYDTVPTSTTKIGYGAIFGMGPDLVAGDWRRGIGLTIDTNHDGIREGLPYNPTNGTKSRGDFWRVIIAHDPVMAKAHFFPMLNN